MSLGLVGLLDLDRRVERAVAVAQADGRHLRAQRGQVVGDDGADALRRARYERALALEKICLVGHSFGALVVQFLMSSLPISVLK